LGVGFNWFQGCRGPVFWGGRSPGLGGPPAKQNGVFGRKETGMLWGGIARSF